MRRLSSIFSFESLELRGRRAPPGFWRAILLAVAVVAVFEGGARWAVDAYGRPANYWDADTGFRLEAYRRHALRDSVSMAIVGDSTGASDLDPREMSAVSAPGFTVYNLACPGSYPLGFRCTNLPLLDDPYAPPKRVLASFSPVGFAERFEGEEFEQTILASSYCQCISPATLQPRCLRLRWLFPVLAYLRDRAPTERRILAAWGRGGFVALPVAERVNGSPKAVPASSFQDHVSPARYRVLEELAALAHRRGFEVVLLIPPSRSTVETAVIRSELRKASVDLGFGLLDLSQPEFLRPEHFADGIHLNAQGAAIFSAEVAKRLVAERR